MAKPMALNRTRLPVPPLHILIWLYGAEGGVEPHGHKPTMPRTQHHRSTTSHLIGRQYIIPMTPAHVKQFTIAATCCGFSPVFFPLGQVFHLLPKIHGHINGECLLYNYNPKGIGPGISQLHNPLRGYATGNQYSNMPKTGQIQAIANFMYQARGNTPPFPGGIKPYSI